MKQALVLLTLFITTFAFSQQKEDVTYEYKKGKKYIVHFALAGNTLWGIHSTFNVPVDDIVKANPGIEKGVVEGQRILIPAGEADGKFPDGTLIKEHTIVKGETLYSLAKKENSSMDEIVKLNPGIENGVKLGQLVKIPLKATPVEGTETTTVSKPSVIPPSVTFSDTVIMHTVLDFETLYSISKRFMVPVEDLQKFNGLKSTKIKPGEVLKIPLKKEKVKEVQVREVKPLEPTKKVDEELLFKKKNQYHIAVMLPFYLDGGESAMQGVATEFYMGLELAVDSLKELGFNAVVHVYDAANDSISLYKILKKPEMKQMDLVIGPLIPQAADIVGRWCKEQKIRMVCPAACNSALLKNNPYVYAAVASDVTLQRILAGYTLEHFAKDQIVLVNTGVAKDRELYDAYRQRFMELSKAKGNVKLIEIKTDDLAGYIRKNGNTVFVVPTRDRGAAVKFMNTLQKSGSKAGNGTISVLGTKDWGGFDDINGFLKNKYNLQYASSSDLNYTLPATKNLLRSYRRKFKADMSRYGAHGFDVFFYFSNWLLMKDNPGQGVINAFDLEPIATGDGYENTQCFILKHVDYELIRVEVADE